MSADDPAPLVVAATGVTRRVRRSDLWLLALAGGVVVLDQATKAGVRALLTLGDSWPSDDWPVRLVHYTNTGAAFGLFQNAAPLLAVASLAGIALILVYLLSPDFAQTPVRVALSLMLGGALGNLIDRVSRGEVVDFIKFPEWPAFNVADSAITIGVTLLLWMTLFARSDPESGTPSSPHAGDESIRS
ncbi:MAG: signal peptidase II [Chloroflexota bacterium]|nr:signal peptidase II [Dehalococcoidia bacterium]MDW8046215.1 signal peptidase II [Chloroflexota bacterium]